MFVESRHRLSVFDLYYARLNTNMGTTSRSKPAWISKTVIFGATFGEQRAKKIVKAMHTPLEDGFLRNLARLFPVLPAIVIALLSQAPAFAESSEAPWQQGEHYDVIEPAIRVGPADEVIVTEFFRYGCPACYSFEAVMSPWKQSLPEGVKLQRSPAVWNSAMQLHAKAYFVAETLDVIDPIHLALFKALQVDRNPLNSEAAIRELFVTNGVKVEEFDKAFNAFGVNTLVRQADARSRAAKMTGTPELMVNGKYRISARKVGSHANMLKVADFLIQKELAAAG